MRPVETVDAVGGAAEASIGAPAAPPRVPDHAAARPVRVLYVVTDTSRMAGANRSLLELVRNLPPDRVLPLVLLIADGPVADAFRRGGVPCLVLPAGPALGSVDGALLRASPFALAAVALRELLPYALDVWRLLRRRRIALVHVNDGRGALLVSAAARLAGVPLVAHLRGELRFRGLVRWITERLPDRIVAVSDGARRTLSPRAQRKAVTVYNGIGPRARPAAGVPFLEALRARDVAVVCCFASLVPFKGYHHLLRAVALLNARGWRDRLAVVCVGARVPQHADYQQWLDRLVGELGIDNVTFAGWHDATQPFYRSADATVLPSVSDEVLSLDARTIQVRGSEGFPRTHLEAMQCGVPIVGTRIAGVPEQVEHGVTGLVVAPGDPAALADALERLLSDPGRARALGRAGAARVRRLFSTEAYVAGVLRVYAELLP